jgi:phosphoribosylanthranilate isomerase
MTITQVKICGLKSLDALDAALTGGADYIGLVFFPPSPRNISLDAAKDLAARARGRAKIVALMVDPDDAMVQRVIAAVAPDFLQLHGEETPERVAEIKRRSGKAVIKAIKVATAADTRAAAPYLSVTDLILFDARPPAGSSRPGGHGATFDWDILKRVDVGGAFMLSGGLTPDNVGEAIRATGAELVDVSSGVERHPGEKDTSLISRFLTAAKGAKQGA